MSDAYRVRRGMDPEDRRKVMAMKERLNPDGSRRWSNEEISRYTGFPVSLICTVEARVHGEAGRPRGDRYEGEPIGGRSPYGAAARANKKMLRALGKASFA